MVVFLKQIKIYFYLIDNNHWRVSLYRIVENPFEKMPIEITEGEYKGLVFQFGKVQFKEGEPYINFQRTIRRLPDIVEVKSDEEIDKLPNNKELEQVMGDILVEIMQDQIERERMNREILKEIDKRHEGEVLEIYEDSLGYLTFGVGTLSQRGMTLNMVNLQEHQFHRKSKRSL